MGREATRREVGSTESGIEAYDMERALGATHEAALDAALETAINVARRTIVADLRDSVLSLAEDIDNSETDLVDDGPAALIYAAMALDETLPPEYRKDEI